MVPVAKRGAVNGMLAAKGTVLVVIQSESACAVPLPRTLPSPSKIFIGKLASKNHPPPVTVPSIAAGEVIRAFAFGIVTARWPSAETIGAVEDAFCDVVGLFADGTKIMTPTKTTMMTARMIDTIFIAFMFLIII